MSIILVGLNHRTAPVELREQLSMAGCGLGMALEELRARASTEGALLKESVILSTCNRLEVYAVAPEPEKGGEAIEHFLTRLQGIPPDVLTPHLYRLRGAEAIEHLMRVASGLDSMILGEHQILGQAAKALDEAQSAGICGSVLSHLFAQAIHTGKRARSETAISRQTNSISHAAAKLAQAEVGDLAEAQVLIIGAGEMAELAAAAMQMRGAQQIACINRTYLSAEELAQQVGGRALNWYHLTSALTDADVVITATGAPHTVLHAHEVEPVLSARQGRPMLIIDVAVPRDVEEAVGRLPGVKRYDIDDLQAALDDNLAQRQAAVPDVERIIAQELTSFLEWLHSREVAPVISDLHRQAVAMVEAEIERALNKLDGLSPEEQKIISQLGYRIANKLLHEPTVRLKACAAEGNGTSYAHAIRELFALDNGNGHLPNHPYGSESPALYAGD
jgi:glutamyl-tRNA reductase